MFIRSARLFLRPGWPEDWSEIFAQIADEAVVRNLSQVPWPYTPEAAHQFAGLPQDARCPHFLVTLPGAEGARLVGCVGLKSSPIGAELGYWFGRAFWNRGFATEATSAVLKLAKTLGHRELSAWHFLDNPASSRPGGLSGATAWRGAAWPIRPNRRSPLVMPATVTAEMTGWDTSEPLDPYPAAGSNWPCAAAISARSS